VQRDSSGVADDGMQCLGGNRGGIQSLFVAHAGAHNTVKIFIIRNDNLMTVYDYPHDPVCCN